MTLIVGLICKDSVILAGESETTRAVSKYQGTLKLHQVTFRNGHVMIGEAGSAYPAGVCIDYFQRLAKDTTIVSDATVADTLDGAYRDYVRASLSPPIGTAECQEFHQKDINNFEFVLGFYAGGKPFLYTFSSIFGIAFKSSRRFEMVGIGGELAEYLIKDIPVFDFKSRAAANTLAYVVGEVKTSISGCGGETQMSIVSNESRPERLSTETISQMEGDLRGILNESKKEFAEQMRRMLEGSGMMYGGFPDDWWQPRGGGNEPDQGLQS